LNQSIGKIIGGSISIFLGIGTVLIYPLFDEQMMLQTVLTFLAGCICIVIFWMGVQIDRIKGSFKSLKVRNREVEAVFETNFAFMWQVDKELTTFKVTEGISSILEEEVDELTISLEYFKQRMDSSDWDATMLYLHDLCDGKSLRHEFRFVNQQGDIKWLEVYGHALYEESGKIQKLIGTAHEITERKETEEQMRHAAYFDSLTGLPNRLKFNIEVQKKIKTCSPEDAQMSVVFLDLDRFKVINETQGHAMGDRVLIKTAERLHNVLGEDVLISRESGDEFLILLEDIDEEQTLQMVEKVIDSFKTPFIYEEESFYLTPSIGISRYPENAQDIHSLVQQAESAMYMVKNNGKNDYHLFVAKDAAEIERKRRIEVELKEAIKRNELSLLYQPKVELETENVYGVEALIRWTHPMLGFISPAEFIPIAEESGIIQEIGHWVLHEALRQNNEWQKQGIDLRISVNVSALQFEDKYFVERVHQTLKFHHIAPEKLILEITESVMQDIKHSAHVISKLHEIGVSVAIDDFGTGYSSLSVLNNVLIDFVKIDKSFIDEILNTENTASLVKTMIQMGKNMNFSIIAEGIETKAQAAFLSENSCKYGQGYYYAKPLKPCEVVQKIS
jgi:diguanylate cyclase (GGDEF)-like protein/PAS domain S-box-containing protein